MKYKIFDVEPDHFDELNLKDCYSLGEVELCKDMVRLSKFNGDSIAYGFGLDDGALHGIAGSYKQWTGVAQFWAIFGKEVENNPVSLTKVCEGLIQYAVKQQQLRRVSLNVRAHYTKGIRFAETLGFDLEGKMWGYLPDGGDANLYARLF